MLLSYWWPSRVPTAPSTSVPPTIVGLTLAGERMKVILLFKFYDLEERPKVGISLYLILRQYYVYIRTALLVVEDGRL